MKKATILTLVAAALSASADMSMIPFSGAARGAALGAGIYKTTGEAFATLEKLDTIEPETAWKQPLEAAYGRWKQEVSNALK